jgi:hypothetical protein
MQKPPGRHGALVGQTATAPDLISLNLMYDYPVRWSPFKVLRDLIQNFYDAVQYRDWGARFSHRMDSGKLFLSARDVGFSYDWLVHIGASTKREHRGDYAGYFGEGFKIAALCALRDHGWQVEMRSRDWELQVVTTHLKVDDRPLQSLAYHIWRRNAPARDTVLCLHPFHDGALLHSVLLSFYYPDNPLCGAKIWESPKAAVYFRSTEPKPMGYPATYDDAGPGIVFAGYQALGSFQYPLIFCLHDFHHHDRERNSFFRMDVVKVIRQTVAQLPPDAAATVLQAVKSRWYDRPRRKYDFDSWHAIIRTLVSTIAASATQKRLWREQHPRLLVARQVKRHDVPQYNRRRQALDWMSTAGRGYRLVQEAFLALGYPTLEEACEQDDGFSVLREPHASELQRIHLLEELVALLLPELLHHVGLPPCKIIKSERAVWRGMTACLPIQGPPPIFRGLPLRYRLPYVALKEGLLHAHHFGNALSTYLHELAHMFGGDRSAAFSHALSELLEITLSNSRVIAQWQEQWEALAKPNG